MYSVEPLCAYGAANIVGGLLIESLGMNIVKPENGDLKK